MIHGRAGKSVKMTTDPIEVISLDHVDVITLDTIEEYGVQGHVRSKRHGDVEETVSKGQSLWRKLPLSLLKVIQINEPIIIHLEV